ncbi:hypothetical protein CROQUDRAFT_651866 [Cronartium quercuum f. sp. fusiforme G11]|uniref:Pre-mRNA-splicing factor SPF27 n=1 Tax=Cronartium quercuum f. sp. fusiforme G11 TaxID=708437 RepID=A0A9P6NPM7_9BASI|nr:hypothetical protein CROQUDRAFT_651866 [Cronartium quercuum f. sp. fusiforme G11]
MSKVTVDSLPYYDRDLDIVPNLRQRVEREIEKELKTQNNLSTCSDSQQRINHPFLEQFPELSSVSSSIKPKEIYHDLLKISLPSLVEQWGINSQPTNHNNDLGLDLERLNIPYPKDLNDLKGWQQSFNNSKAQLEQQRLRLLNLNLINQFGSNHWKLYNFLIEKEISKLTLILDDFTNQIDRVNRRRKANQTDVGDQLNDLSQKWQNLISNNISIEIMNLNLTNEIKSLKLEEEELKKKLDKIS